MADPDVLFRELVEYVDELERQFIAEFLPVNPTMAPVEFEHKVKAYCVLCHAAFEEFFESIALSVMDESITRWTINKRATDSRITLVSYCGMGLEIDDYERISFDYMRDLLERTKTVFSKRVYDNHGVAIDYVSRLMIPVALDISSDPNLRNSLGQLASRRGAFAHRGRVKVVLSPEDAKKYVVDCLEMARDIVDKVKRRLCKFFSVNWSGLSEASSEL